LILWVLAKGEKSVGEIAAAVEASLQNTSQHLRLMKDRGILTGRREGQTIYYRIADLALSGRLGLASSDNYPGKINLPYKESKNDHN